MPAISVHKAQGAEFLAVVILLLTSHAAILGRTLLHSRHPCATPRRHRRAAAGPGLGGQGLAAHRGTRHSPGSSAERSAIPGPASPRRCWRRSVRCRCRRRGKDCSGKQRPDHPEGTLRSSDGPLEPFQDRHHPFAGQGDPDLDGRAHATRSIAYRQDPESPPVDQAVGQEIHAPPLLRTLCWQWRTRGARSAFAGIAICGHCGGALHFPATGTAGPVFTATRSARSSAAASAPASSTASRRRSPPARSVPAAGGDGRPDCRVRTSA